jgi:C4-type Zn-finger protein
MILKNKTYNFKVICSICKKELALHRSLVDIEYSGNFAATSSKTYLTKLTTTSTAGTYVVT